MRSIHLRKIGGAFALWAVLLTVFAPLISQVLQGRQPIDVALTAFCSSTGMVYRGPVAAPPIPGVDTVGRRSPDRPDQAPSHQLNACGYCGFAAHFPGLASASLTPVPASPATFAEPGTAVPAFHSLKLERWAEARAPPPLLV